MSHAPRIESGPPRSNDLDRDRALVESVLGGSLTAWHDLIDRYSGLIYGVIRRQLFTEDDDDIRGVYVEVLQALYRGGLATFEGRSSLATWLIVFSRHRALDLLRRRRGRLRPPRWYVRLDDLRQELVRLHFVEKLPLDAVVHQIRAGGHPIGRDEVVSILLELCETIPRRSLYRIDAVPVRREDVEARTEELMSDLRVLDESVGGTGTAGDGEARLVAEEERERVDRLRVAMARLSREEQEIIRMRFYEGWTARRFARELGLNGPRKVYSLIDRGLAKLKKVLDAGEDER